MMKGIIAVAMMGRPKKIIAVFHVSYNPPTKKSSKDI
jgi:hypothetical protein